MDNFKNFVRRIILGRRSSSESYIEDLRKRGIHVGEDVVIYRPFNTNIDILDPHLLSIGDHVKITGPATILTHDYSWSVLKHKYGYICGKQKEVRIGNNVFIGWGSTILSETIIGDNVIIGANSVVSGKIPNDSVYAGNPASFIMSLDDFFEKRKKAQLKEAVDYVAAYKDRFGKFPKREELDEYFFLFWNEDYDSQVESFEKKLHLTNNYDYSVQTLKREKHFFSCYEDFLEYCVKYCSRHETDCEKGEG